MTPGERLTRWQKEWGLKDPQAAKLMRLHVQSYREQRRGNTKDCDQTMLLLDFYEAFGLNKHKVRETIKVLSFLLTIMP